MATVDTSAITVGLADIYVNGVDVGSVSDGELEVTLETLEHKAGLPLKIDKKVIIERGAKFTATWEEVKAENLRIATGVAPASTTELSATVVTVTGDVVYMGGNDWGGLTHNNIQLNTVTTITGMPAGVIDTAVAAGATGVTFTTSHDFDTSDYIQVGNESGFTVNAIPNGKSVTLNSGVSAAVASGSYAFGYLNMANGQPQGGVADEHFTENVDFVIDRQAGKVRRRIDPDTGLCDITDMSYVAFTYDYLSNSRTRLPIGKEDAVLELPFRAIHTRPDASEFIIHFWKSSPGGTFTIGFAADSFLGYSVEFTALNDEAKHPNDPLGYIELSA